MKNSLLTLMLMIFCSAALLAVSPVDAKTMKDRMNEGSAMIDAELSNLTILNDAIVAQNLDFDALSAEYSTLVDDSNLSAAAAPGILSGHPDVPFGIPGFYWGLIGGCLGMLVVYLVMDSGSGRKEQVRNSLYGCLISTIIWTLIGSI